jgi:hypothetical protein
MPLHQLTVFERPFYEHIVKQRDEATGLRITNTTGQYQYRVP